MLKLHRIDGGPYHLSRRARWDTFYGREFYDVVGSRYLKIQHMGNPYIALQSMIELCSTFQDNWEALLP